MGTLARHLSHRTPAWPGEDTAGQLHDLRKGDHAGRGRRIESRLPKRWPHLFVSSPSSRRAWASSASISIEQHPPAARAVHLVEQLLHVGGLVPRQRRPTTFTSYFSMARRMVAPQPQPTSSSVMPGCRPSLPSARSILASWASSSVMPPRSKYAQL